MGDNTLRGRVTTLEANYINLQGDVTEIKNDVKSLVKSKNIQTGVRKTTAWLLGILATSGFFMVIFDHFTKYVTCDFC